jgi:hypothetical protein
MLAAARRWAGLFVVGLLCSACNGKVSAHGGETNWSKTCKTSIDCSGAESCSGGFCVSRKGAAFAAGHDAGPTGAGGSVGMGSAGTGGAGMGGTDRHDASVDPAGGRPGDGGKSNAGAKGTGGSRGSPGARDMSTSPDSGAGGMTPDVTSGSDSGLLQSDCFELQAHGAGMLPDDSPYAVPPGEHMHSFFFNVPYEALFDGIRFEPILDGSDPVVVQHIWLFEKRSKKAPEGSDEATIGIHDGDEFVYAWGPGLQSFELPDGVSAYLPPPSGQFEMEMLYTNYLGRNVSDRSGVRICVAPPRAHTATLTVTGTENIDVPANGMASAAGPCSFTGAQPAQLVAVMPSMHRAGRAMNIGIERATGTDTVLDQAFDYQQHQYYPTPLTVNPGDKMVTRCTYQNDLSSPITYGPSVTFEECYAFIFAYPADDFVGTPGIIGARNMCIF